MPRNDGRNNNQPRPPAFLNISSIKSLGLIFCIECFFEHSSISLSYIFLLLLSYSHILQV